MKNNFLRKFCISWNLFKNRDRDERAYIQVFSPVAAAPLRRRILFPSVRVGNLYVLVKPESCTAESDALFFNSPESIRFFESFPTSLYSESNFYRVYSLPLFQIIIGLLCPPYIAKLEFKTKEELQLMPQTEEEHLFGLDDENESIEEHSHDGQHRNTEADVEVS